MSKTSAARRLKRKMEQDIRKGINNGKNHLNIPTAEDIQKYIDKKIIELNKKDNGM
jgi:hypothetical protein